MQPGLLLPSFAGGILLPKSSVLRRIPGTEGLCSQQAAQGSSLDSGWLPQPSRDWGVGDGSIAWRLCCVPPLPWVLVYKVRLGSMMGDCCGLRWPPRASQEISRGGWVGACLRWGSLEESVRPGSLLSNSGTAAVAHNLWAPGQLGFITLTPSVAFRSHL